MFKNKRYNAIVIDLSFVAPGNSNGLNINKAVSVNSMLGKTKQDQKWLHALLFYLCYEKKRKKN